MTLFRKTVSASFRALVAELHPGLGANRAYWQFFGYLLFGTFFDRDTKLLVIGQRLLAKMEEKPVNHYRAVDFLEAFRRDVLSAETFEWTAWAANKDSRGKCRQVKKLILHPRLKEAYEAELLKVHHSAGRVYFVDGTVFSRAKQAATRKEYLRGAVEALKRIDCDLAGRVLDYFNKLPPHRFTKLIKKNLAGALAVANSLDDRRVRDMELRILQGIADNPQPFYAPSTKERTVRIFGVLECIVSLKRAVRLALTRGNSEADLVSSQLAICAKVWNIREIGDFLASGKSIWVHLCEQLGYTAADKGWLKDALKEPLYAACYGMPKPKVQAMFTRNLNEKGIRKGGARVLGSPLMTALLGARARMVEQIQAAGGGLTCFGKWIELSQAVDAYSILAQQAQAVELRLLSPLIKLASEHPDEFTVLLWQHDGVTVQFHRRPEHWIRRITETVQSGIDASGIKTRLEWDHNTEKKERHTENTTQPQPQQEEREPTNTGETTWGGTQPPTHNDTRNPPRPPTTTRPPQDPHSNHRLAIARGGLGKLPLQNLPDNQQPYLLIPTCEENSPAIARG